MRRFIIATGIVVLFASAGFACDESLLARVTVYWASGGGGSDANTRQHKTATGARLRAGHCAVDPKKIAYGSKVIFPDSACVAVDTGRDVITRKAARRAGRTASERSAIVIDRFFETKGQALRWANAHPHFMTVRVLSPEKQLALTSKSPQVIAQKQAPPSTSEVIAQNIAQKKLVAANAHPLALQLSRRF